MLLHKLLPSRARLLWVITPDLKIYSRAFTHVSVQPASGSVQSSKSTGQDGVCVDFTDFKLSAHLGAIEIWLCVMLARPADTFSDRACAVYRRVTAPVPGACGH